MSLILPTDDNGNPIAVLGYEYRGTQRVAVGAASTRNTQPMAGHVGVVTIVATSFCRFEVGGADVTADADRSPILFPGQYLDIPLRPADRYVAFLATGEACDAYLMARV